MASDAALAEPNLALRSNKRPPCQSPPWLVAPSTSAARHLHPAVTTDATTVTRYACPDDGTSADPVTDCEMRVLMRTRRTINRSGDTTTPGQPARHMRTGLPAPSTGRHDAARSIDTGSLTIFMSSRRGGPQAPRALINDNLTELADHTHLRH